MNYSDRTDFFGAKHKYHRDADGLYSPPPYLFDELSSGYDNFLVNGVMPEDDPNKMTLRLSSLTDDAGRKTEYSLGSLGRLYWVNSNETYSGSTLVSYCETDYTYDTDAGQLGYSHNWLKQITTSWHQLLNGNWQTSTLWNHAYLNYDAIGQRLSNAITDNTGATRTETYGYDNLNRANSVNYGDGQTQSYTFDAMGNRMSKTDAGGGINGTENYAYNNANMLTSRGSNAYTNDMNGNTLTGAGHTNTWDSENRLNQCVYVNGGTTTTSNFLYGADGQRHQVSSVVNGTTTTTNFVLDNSMLVGPNPPKLSPGAI